MTGRHVVIVGAGIVGLCSADALLRRGFQVTVVEREIDPSSGCSWGNGGLIVPSHFVPLASPGMVGMGLRMLLDRESPFGFSQFPNLEMALWMARFALAANRSHVDKCASVLRDMNLGSRALYETVYRDIATGYQRQGELMICKTKKGLDAEAHLGEEAKRLGLKTSILDRKALADFETGIEIDAVGAIYFEDDAHLTPALLMPALKTRIQGLGANFVTAEVTGLRVEGGLAKAAICSGDEIVGDEFVLACGSWTGRLAKTLGLRLPLLGGRGYGFTVSNPPAIPRYPAILTEGRVAVTPMANGLRFVGTMEIGPPIDSPVNQGRLAGMRKSIRSTYPALRDVDLEALSAWSGFRPVTPDGMPYLGRPRQFQNIAVATGHGMMGMSLGPISGELIAQLLTNEPRSIPTETLTLERF